MLENERGCKIGNIVRIHSDHGREFENSEFSNYCNECGIFHEVFDPKTPQHNGVIERKK